MKLYLPFISLLILFSSCFNGRHIQKPEEDEESESKAENLEDLFRQEYDRTKDPRTGIVPKIRLVESFNYARRKSREVASNRGEKAIPGIVWTERGPWQVGGRTRALLWDKNDVNKTKVWAGSAGGGIWYCNNIFNATPVWEKVEDFLDNLSISCIIQDDNNHQLMYAATGEPFAPDRINGIGVLVSTNGGVNWNLLNADNNAQLGSIQKILIDKSNRLVAATTSQGVAWYDPAKQTWVSFGFYTSQAAYDLEMNSGGDLFASFQGVGPTWSTVWKQSYPYNFNWTEITPAFYVGNTVKRVEIAVAPNDDNRLYLLAEGADKECSYVNVSYDEGKSYFARSVPTIDDAGNTTNFARDQAWYGLICTVDPNNADRIYLGGIDIVTSATAGVDWQQITWWESGHGEGETIHADQHSIMFRPGSSTTAIVGNDGGVFFCANLGNVHPDFVSKSEGYRVTQFYSVASGINDNNYFIAGAQDNGNQRFTYGNGKYTTKATEGDGAFTHIDHTDSKLQIAAYVFNDYRVSTDGGENWQKKKFGEKTGSFINPTAYNRNNYNLYAAWGINQVFRWDEVSKVGDHGTILTWQDFNGGMVTHLSIGGADPQSVFAGLNNGRVMRIEDPGLLSGDPALASVVFTDSVPGGSVSCVAQDYRNGNHLMVTFSNYGVPSIWESFDNGGSWRNAEGNLPDMPVRWCVFHPDDPNRAFIATELGVWSTDDLSGKTTGGTVEWTPTNGGLANTRVDMIRLNWEDLGEYKTYYSGDMYMAAATHGRGLFTTIIPKIPNVKFTSKNRVVPEFPTVVDGCERYTDYQFSLRITAPASKEVHVVVEPDNGYSGKQGKDYDIFVDDVKDNKITFPAGVALDYKLMFRVYDDGLVNGNREAVLRVKLKDAGNDVIIDPYEDTCKFFIKDNDTEPNFNEHTEDVLIDGYYNSFSEAYSPFTHAYGSSLTQYFYDSIYLIKSGLKPGVEIKSISLYLQKHSLAPYKSMTLLPNNTYQDGKSSGLQLLQGRGSEINESFKTTSGWNVFGNMGGFQWQKDMNLGIQVSVNANNCPDASNGGDAIEGYSDSRTSGKFQYYGSQCQGLYTSPAFRGSGKAVLKITQLYYSEASYEKYDSSMEKLGPFETISFKSNKSVVLGKVENLSAHDYGCVKFQLDRAGNGTNPFWSNNPSNNLMDKTFKITPEFNNQSGHYRITLYFTKYEAYGWMEATGHKWNEIELVKVPGAIAATSPGNYFPGAEKQPIVIADSVGTGKGLTYRISAEFFTGFSGFGAGVPGTEPETLPLNLLTFNGAYKNEAVQLTWETSNEINTDRFIIEKSFNTADYKKIGSLNAIGSSRLSNRYSYLDDKDIKARQYYRLKQVDRDGTYHYSAIIEITRIVSNNIVASFTSANQLKIATASSLAGKVEIILTDRIGRIYKKFVLTGLSSGSTILNTERNPPPGVYFVVIYNGDRKITVKLLAP